jgi:hypothetical protein
MSLTKKIPNNQYAHKSLISSKLVQVNYQLTYKNFINLITKKNDRILVMDC